MRLWSLHPKYLDAQGLVALWREALLAKAVLGGRTRGYGFDRGKIGPTRAQSRGRRQMATDFAARRAPGVPAREGTCRPMGTGARVSLTCARQPG